MKEALLPLTIDALREVLNGLSREQLIEWIVNDFTLREKMITSIAVNQQISICEHQWQPIASPPTGIHRYQCFKCGRIKDSTDGECITINSFQKITNK